MLFIELFNRLNKPDFLLVVLSKPWEDVHQPSQGVTITLGLRPLCPILKWSLVAQTAGVLAVKLPRQEHSDK